MFGVIGTLFAAFIVRNSQLFVTELLTGRWGLHTNLPQELAGSRQTPEQEEYLRTYLCCRYLWCGWAGQIDTHTHTEREGERERERERAIALFGKLTI